MASSSRQGDRRPQALGLVASNPNFLDHDPSCRKRENAASGIGLTGFIGSTWLTGLSVTAIRFW